MFRAAFQSALPWKSQSGFLHMNVAWSSLLPGRVNPHAEQRREVFGAGTLTSRPPWRLSLYVSIVTVRPHASCAMERLRPALALTFVPGSWVVPRADLTMFE
ncbi:hypothetical protein SRB17_90480 [Streptomyces sp. RB17]|nr:hypothetical protein [Streptomyces sp. RB17]